MTALLGLAVLTVGLSAGAVAPIDDQGPAQSPTNRAAEIRTGSIVPGVVTPPSRKDIFGGLFTPGGRSSPQFAFHRKPMDAQSSSTRIVCGTVVVQADPKVDLAIAIPVPENPNQFSMRRITPPFCPK
jgi:hypothetical protein